MRQSVQQVKEHLIFHLPLLCARLLVRGLVGGWVGVEWSVFVEEELYCMRKSAFDMCAAGAGTRAHVRSMHVH